MILYSECTDCSNEHPEQSPNMYYDKQTIPFCEQTKRIVCSVHIVGTEQSEQSTNSLKVRIIKRKWLR